MHHSVQVGSEQRLEGLTLKPGEYRIATLETGDLTCDEAENELREILRSPGAALPAGWKLDRPSRTFSREDGSDRFRVSGAVPPATELDEGFGWQDVQDWAVMWLPIIFMGLIAVALIMTLRYMPAPSRSRSSVTRRRSSPAATTARRSAPRTSGRPRARDRGRAVTPRDQRAREARRGLPRGWARALLRAARIRGEGAPDLDHSARQGARLR